MDDRRRFQAGPASGSSEAATWIPCPTCWGQRRIFEPERAPGVARATLVARPCPGCLGIGEVIQGEPPAAAEEPAAPAEEPARAATWAVPRRTRVAIRAAAAVGCALAAGAVAAFVAAPVAAAAIGALIGLFCHLSMGEAPAG